MIMEAASAEPIILKTDLFGACYEGLMKATRSSSRTYHENKSGTVERREQVDIHGIKLWAKANLPAISHLRGILLLEGDLLTVDEFLAKMDIWLKLIDLEEHPLI